MRSSSTLGLTMPNVHKRSANNEFAAQRIKPRITPVAISIDPSDASKSFKQCRGFTFTFLSDPNSEVIRAMICCTSMAVLKNKGRTRPKRLSLLHYVS